MSSKITLTNAEKGRIENALPYLKNGQWDVAFQRVAGIGDMRFSFQGNYTIHILFFLKENNIDLWHNITELPRHAFWYCGDLETIEIPSNIKKLSADAFSHCYKLNSVTMSNGIEEIGQDAFWQCEALRTITFKGTQEQWNNVNKDREWHNGSGIETVKCSDGSIEV